MEKELLKVICSGLPVSPLPENKGRSSSIAHAANKNLNLSYAEKKIAISNALRYFPSNVHKILAKEFSNELKEFGHIYMYRLLPPIEMKAYPIDFYPARSLKAAGIMMMIMNNLDPRVAQFPEELVTYGGNGQVFSNWAQFWIVLNYLSEMDDFQTLVMYSGHPMGLFPSNENSPRCVITNGMMIPNYSSKELYEKLFALNVTMYGQMTAGSYCYIGPQGIVHGTYLTILNIYRKHMGNDNLKGKVFLSAGLGGMSGAQAKAGYLLGTITVIAEVSEEALLKRHSQGWVKEVCRDLNTLLDRVLECRRTNTATSIGFHGNVVCVWEYFLEYTKRTGELLIDLASDQTSCHNPFLGGYYPVQLTYEQSKKMMFENQSEFKRMVQESLVRQIKCIDELTKYGMKFWDYGNAFLLEASRAGADLRDPNDATGTKFRYPSYMQDVMGDIFSLGFGPFRWICSSNDETDLVKTDKIAENCILEILKSPTLSKKVRDQYEDNLKWIQGAGSWNLVVGSKARILYCDQIGRTKIALAFNEMVKKGFLKAPIILSRDHHDVSGTVRPIRFLNEPLTNSPFRETSNIYDGSAFTADMAVQNAIGDSFRGATWVALHNGGGVGWGEVTNGGFGLVVDGSEQAAKNAECMLGWDVSNGVARRCWSGNLNAKETILNTMKISNGLKVTIPSQIESDEIFEDIL